MSYKFANSLPNKGERTEKRKELKNLMPTLLIPVLLNLNVTEVLGEERSLY